MVFDVMVNCVDFLELKFCFVFYLRLSFNNVIVGYMGYGMEYIEIVDMIEYVGSFVIDIGSWKEVVVMKKEVLE